MPDPSWPSSPPEINNLRLVGAGAGGSATTLASGTAWQAVTTSSEAACSISATNTVCTAPGFEGVGGAASAASVTQLNGSLHLLAAWAQEKVGIAAAAVSAYQTAISSMIPAAVSVANRTEQAADVAMNPAVFGALTPAIIALDTIYFGEHWPHNAAIGAAYGAALAALTGALAIPPPMPANVSPAASPLGAAESVAQAAAGEATKASGKLTNQTDISTESTAEALLRPLSGLTTPIGSMGGMPMQAMSPASTQVLSGLAGSAELLPQHPFDDQADVLAYAPALPIAGLPTMGIPSAASSPGIGQVAAPLGAGTGPGLTATTYAKPATAFPVEPGGRPVGLKDGAALSARQQGPANAGVGVAPTPLAGKDRSRSANTDVARARVLPWADSRSDEPD